MQKFLEVLQALLAVIGGLSFLCGVAANVLPDGKAKTAFSFAGSRLVKAGKIISGAIPVTPTGEIAKPKADADPAKPDGAS